MGWLNWLLGSLNPIITRFEVSAGHGIVYVLSMVLAISIAMSVHEWAHAYTAYKLGDPTAKNMGRMTLDPTKHVDPIGLATFILFGFGWARPVMVNPRNLKHYRRDDALISLAGPLSNLLLTFVFVGIFVVLPFSAAWYTDLMSMMINYNLALAVFNLIPLPPLDGFHVLSSVLVRKANPVVQFLQNNGQWILMLLLFTGVLAQPLNWLTYNIGSLFFNFFKLFR